MLMSHTHLVSQGSIVLGRLLACVMLADTQNFAF